MVQIRTKSIREFIHIALQACADPSHRFPPGDIFYTLWDFFIPAFNCPHRLDRIGALGDGGKWVCGVDRLAAQHAPCVVYSFGINKDSSFEAALLQRAPNCEVWGYDYSVTIFGPEIHDNPVLSPKTHFSPYMLGAHDNPHLDPPEWTVQGLMARNGHAFVDLLKVDIEGGEFDALAAFLKPFVGASAPVLPVGQLEIEIHAWNERGDFAPFYSWWLLMEKAGLRPFFTEPNIVHVSHLRTRPDVVEVRIPAEQGRLSLTSPHSIRCSTPRGVTPSSRPTTENRQKTCTGCKT